MFLSNNMGYFEKKYDSCCRGPRQGSSAKIWSTIKLVIFTVKYLRLWQSQKSLCIYRAPKNAISTNFSKWMVKLKQWIKGFANKFICINHFYNTMYMYIKSNSRSIGISKIILYKKFHLYFNLYYYEISNKNGKIKQKKSKVFERFLSLQLTITGTCISNLSVRGEL